MYNPRISYAIIAAGHLGRRVNHALKATEAALFVEVVWQCPTTLWWLPVPDSKQSNSAECALKLVSSLLGTANSILKQRYAFGAHDNPQLHWRSRNIGIGPDPRVPEGGVSWVAWDPA